MALLTSSPAGGEVSLLYPTLQHSYLSHIYTAPYSLNMKHTQKAPLLKAWLQTGKFTTERLLGTLSSQGRCGQTSRECMTPPGPTLLTPLMESGGSKFSTLPQDREVINSCWGGRCFLKVTPTTGPDVNHCFIKLDLGRPFLWSAALWHK